MTDVEAQKRQAAEKAVAYVEDGMRVGLGTGSTARHVVDVISELLRHGTLRDIIGVPTSRATEEYARQAGVPVATLDEQPQLDVTIDGADEIDPDLDLIKGLGGALLWEKIVATASDQLIIVADASKRVRRLGEKAPLPVEIVPFGWRTQLDFLENLDCTPVLRRTREGAPFISDGGHYIIDCRFDGAIPDPYVTHMALAERAGVVDCGLFLSMAAIAVIAGPGGAVTLTRDGES